VVTLRGAEGLTGQQRTQAAEHIRAAVTQVARGNFDSVIRNYPDFARYLATHYEQWIPLGVDCPEFAELSLEERITVFSGILSNGLRNAHGARQT
jgi:hypothetical protein